MKKPVDSFSSICFPENSDYFYHPGEVDPETRSALLEQYHRELEKCSPRETWAGDAHQKSAPYPILGSVGHQRQLADLSEALVLAITDIVQRWWSDVDARFPERMPIDPVEEKLLQWMEGLGTDVLRPYRFVQGSWRPDFLLESSEDPEQIENYRICEINARFFPNGFLFIAFGQQALINMGIEKHGLKGAADPKRVITGLSKLVDPSLPLHVAKGEEYGFDIRIWRVFRRIHQLGLELHQRELLAMSYEMLQQISLRCFNDLRTVSLVHDKRMLGLVLEELNTLVSRNVISSRQAKILNRGLVHTFIPGSTKLKNLITTCQSDTLFKDKHMLKPVRSGKGKGILFGDQISHDEWLSILQSMRDPFLKDGETTYVVQTQVQQRRYDVLLEEEKGIGNFPLIGTFHITHGVFLGLGLWRSGPGRICALSRGGSWVCTVIQQ
ncbi:uncharacterized protein N7498_004129 [Penicillium cinerascens]|uniref:Uncharacterized protein n=1 Tax=Penicillium cinerascens TaxID=70096 RepID=A0A9W9N4E5_9EURO|nr:uncharacterized protein N7498_004129 [Penicillium cinerascens]KAJ5212483.1 hypothetical protein N7498_004129 [Penicillium cinerascens]